MKDVVREFLDARISRRTLMSRLAAAGVAASGAKAMAQALSDDTMPGAVSDVTDGGGRLYVEQLRAAGVEFIFFNPSTRDAPIYDALVDDPSIHLIKGVHEGAVVAMADGYARVSGKPGIAIVADIGVPSAMAMMVNSYKDQIPLLLTTVTTTRADAGRGTFPQEYDFQDEMLGPMTKWRWVVRDAGAIPESMRRALKFAMTAPGGPVFLSIPGSELGATATARIIDQSLFTVSMKNRPSEADIMKAARMLIEARNPLLTVGDEITLCNAEQEVLQLAELLGLPVSGQSEFGCWSKPFPTRHPLFLGPMQPGMPFPEGLDVRLNIGNRYAEDAIPGVRTISLRRDPVSMARVHPIDLPIVADIKLATDDLISAIKSLATADRLRRVASERRERAAAFTRHQEQLRQDIARRNYAESPITLERLAVELERTLDKDTIFVTECDSGKSMDPLMSFGGDDKTYLSTGPLALGWAVPAACGVKLAKPDRPVVAILGDGAMLFGGMQPLWSIARYKAPVTVIVFNNRSYNNERNRIWIYIGGEQLKHGRDMTCYNGNPDVDFAKASIAFGVEAETVTDPDAIAGALKRAKQANIEGRPYLLDIVVQRNGVGWASTYYPEYSIAASRTRKV